MFYEDLSNYPSSGLYTCCRLIFCLYSTVRLRQLGSFLNFYQHNGHVGGILTQGLFPYWEITISNCGPASNFSPLALMLEICIIAHWHYLHCHFSFQHWLCNSSSWEDLPIIFFLAPKPTAYLTWTRFLTDVPLLLVVTHVLASSLLYWTGSIALINNLSNIFTFSSHLRTGMQWKENDCQLLSVSFMVSSVWLIVRETMVSQVVHIRGHSAGISSSDEEIAWREGGSETASPTWQNDQLCTFQLNWSRQMFADGNGPTKDITSTNVR